MSIAEKIWRRLGLFCYNGVSSLEVLMKISDLEIKYSKVIENRIMSRKTVLWNHLNG